jgi:CheY-like chemotaxis protein/molybdopterin-guanine dinucleotide biosynthesis protein
MEIITKQSEKILEEILQRAQKAPDDWMSIHVNIAPIHTQMMEKEGLSRKLLRKVHAISIQIATKINDSGFSKADGKIMVFEDSDVLALFKKTSATGLDSILSRLRSEFTKCALIDILEIEEMKDKLSKLIVFSEEKTQTSEDYRIKKLAVDIGENLTNWKNSDPGLTIAIQKRRRLRSAIYVLIIEDDVMVRGLIASMLRDEYQILQARNAETGIITYIDRAPNIVFLDIHMPGLGGCETLKHLKQIDPASYVVMLSGDSTSNNVISTRAEGASGFIGKPFSKEKLDEYIKKCPSIISKTVSPE